MYSTLRGLLSHPHPTQWRKLLQLFDQWPEPSERQVALEYAREHLHEWPDEHRCLDVLDPSHRCWSLAKKIHLGGGPKTSVVDFRLDAEVEHITILEVNKASRYEHIDEIRRFSQLEKLSLDLSLSLRQTHLDFLAPLTKLRVLVLEGGIFVESMEALASLSRLEDLSLLDMGLVPEDSVLDLGVLARLPRLTRLHAGLSNPAYQDVQLEKAEALAGMGQLQSLTLAYCEGLEELSPLASLTSLKQLDLTGSLATTRGLSALPQLRRLCLAHCPEAVVDLEDVAQLTQLRALDLSHNPQLRQLAGLEGLLQLQELRLDGLLDIADPLVLGQLSKLELLSLRQAQLSQLPSLGSWPRLRHLDLAGCLAPLPQGWDPLSRLEYLDLKDSPMVAPPLRQTLQSASAVRHFLHTAPFAL